MGCLSIIMSIFNVIFWLLGGALIGLTVWMLVDDETFQHLQVVGNEWYWEVSLYIILSVGIIIFLVGFLGCVGACTENRLILILYAVFVSLSIVAEIVAIVFVAIFYANRGDIGYTMKYDVQNKYYSEYSYDSTSSAWNAMQIQWQCCGSYGPQDYKGSLFQQNNPDSIVPWTCCTMKYDVSPKYATKDDVLNPIVCQANAAVGGGPYVNSYGCYYEVRDIVDLAAPITLGVLSGFVVVQLVGIVMSCVICSRSKGVSPSSGKMI